MNIALVAHDSKKELLAQLCMAYENILSAHNLFSTAPTANVIMRDTGLKIQKFLSGYNGGCAQISSRVAYDELDIIIYLIDHDDPMAYDPDAQMIIKQCDLSNVPLATNIATAECMIHGLVHGDFAWKEILRRNAEGF